jgi:phosphoketolase
MAQQLYQTLLDKSITVGCKELEDQKLSYSDLKTWLIRHYGAGSTVTALYLHANFQLKQPKPDPPCPTCHGTSKLSTSN